MNARQIFTGLILTILTTNLFSAEIICEKSKISKYDAIAKLNALLVAKPDVTITGPFTFSDDHSDNYPIYFNYACVGVNENKL